MYVDTLTFRDFRNLGGRVQVAWPVAVLVGANNTGKSNVVDALRMVLTPQSGYRERLGLERDDFRHDGSGVTQATELEIEVSFGGLSAPQPRADAHHAPTQARARAVQSCGCGRRCQSAGARAP